MSSFYLSNPYQPPPAPEVLLLQQAWPLLGGLSPQAFMRDYWHRQPLLVRGAIPAFQQAKALGQPLDSPISSQALLALATTGESEARLVRSKPWRLQDLNAEPLKSKALPKLSDPHWTLLIQGAEAHHAAAAKVLSWFRFIPDARLDDLMISLAGKGGGVGPHFDSYDVFLLQMAGRRKWSISTKSDLKLKAGLPLKILRNFKAQEEWILEPGDMLYLPPNTAHNGIALDSGCQTWSIGFRSPTYRELLQEGLWRLAESLDEAPAFDGRYADPLQSATDKPEALPAELIKQLKKRLKALDLKDINQFLTGISAYLSEPKPSAYFVGPTNPLSYPQFIKKLGTIPLHLHPLSRMICHEQQIFCNGENVTQLATPLSIALWRSLAAKKTAILSAAQRLALKPAKGHSADSLYSAYQAGWLIFEPLHE